MVLCCDGGNVWRKDIYPYYKASRLKPKDDSIVDWAEFGRIFSVLTEEFKNNLPYRLVRVYRAEGDDCIAVLAKNLPGPHMIVSNDEDFGQLQKYMGVEQYCPRREQKFKVDNPVLFLKEHVIRGDAGDGVPNCLSDDDTFVNPDKRQKSIFAKKLENWLYQDYESFCDIEKAKRNIAMVDFDSIPEEISNQIMIEFENAHVTPKSQVITYFGQKKLRALIDSISSM